MRRRGAAVTVAALALAVGNCAVANAAAPSVVGQKFGDASAAISKAGMQAVVATTVGDRLPRQDCVVSNQHSQTMAAAENSAGSATNEVLLSLNCDAEAASATLPGYSAGSPEAKAIAAKAKSDQGSGSSS